MSDKPKPILASANPAVVKGLAQMEAEDATLVDPAADAVVEEEASQDIEVVPEPVEPVEPQPEPYHQYFLMAVRVTYERDRKLKERTVNVILAHDNHCLTRDVLNRVNHMAGQRVVTENKVDAKALRDLVVVGAVYLGQMTEAQFNARPKAAPVSIGGVPVQ